MAGWNNNNIDPAYTVVLDAATITIDTLSAMTFAWVMSQNTTLTFSNNGHEVNLVVTCDATPRTIDWTGGGIHSTATTYVLTANKKHVFSFVYDGTEHVLKSVTVLS
jgi:hypothetical protein